MSVVMVLNNAKMVRMRRIARAATVPFTRFRSIHVRLVTAASAWTTSVGLILSVLSQLAVIRCSAPLAIKSTSNF
jgi:hypothetical protein